MCYIISVVIKPNNITAIYETTSYKYNIYQIYISALK